VFKFYSLCLRIYNVDRLLFGNVIIIMMTNENWLKYNARANQFDDLTFLFIFTEAYRCKKPTEEESAPKTTVTTQSCANSRWSLPESETTTATTIRPKTQRWVQTEILLINERQRLILSTWNNNNWCVNRDCFVPTEICLLFTCKQFVHVFRDLAAFRYCIYIYTVKITKFNSIQPKHCFRVSL